MPGTASKRKLHLIIAKRFNSIAGTALIVPSMVYAKTDQHAIYANNVDIGKMYQMAL
jgi:hypothetical protein